MLGGREEERHVHIVPDVAGRQSVERNAGDIGHKVVVGGGTVAGALQLFKDQSLIVVVNGAIGSFVVGFMGVGGNKHFLALLEWNLPGFDADLQALSLALLIPEIALLTAHPECTAGKIFKPDCAPNPESRIAQDEVQVSDREAGEAAGL